MQSAIEIIVEFFVDCADCERNGVVSCYIVVESRIQKMHQDILHFIIKMFTVRYMGIGHESMK